MKFKKTILLDLDGVLNQYTGNYDENFIPPVKDGAQELLIKLSKDFKIKIFTSRNKVSTQKWLEENDLHQYISGITNTKEPAYIQIDDRCIKFDGNYNNLIDQITNFEVWYKA